MLYLSEPSKTDLSDYFSSVKPLVLAAKAKSKIKKEVLNFLTDQKLEEIITDRPEKLLKHHADILSIYISGYNQNEFDAYLKIRNKKKPNAGDKILISKYKKSNYLSSIFDYNSFFKKNKDVAYPLASKLNRNTCTYCNRLYTHTIVTNEKGTIDKRRVTRPQFDHWYSKSNYPILALSFYNLIPSCNVCNSSIKHNSNFQINTHSHPYIIDKNESFKFSYYCKSINKNNVKIKDIRGTKTALTISEMKVKEVYNAHSDLELKDLLELRYKYSNNYLDILLNKTFKGLGIGKEEACRLIFGIEINELNFHKRPLSKFKKDILDELGVKFDK